MQVREKSQRTGKKNYNAPLPLLSSLLCLASLLLSVPLLSFTLPTKPTPRYADEFDSALVRAKGGK